MPCFYPITAFQPLEGGPLSWHERRDMRQLEIPCGQCTGCRLRYSAHWATRCMHEAKTHSVNSWVTLTYSDENLPEKFNTGLINPITKKIIYSGTLYKPHMQTFLRTLRKRRFPPRPKGGGSGGKINIRQRLDERISRCNCASCAPAKTLARKVRYYYAGEYGEKYGRPHYHICLFGITFADAKYEQTTDTGYKLYTSETITQLWPHGEHSIGELTWEAAAYTARYVMKKINGKKQKEHYKKIDVETGEIKSAMPEYCDMSRRPGLAQKWINQYMTSVYPHDRVIIRGKRTQPPRYYDKQYAQLYPEHLDELKQERLLKLTGNWEDYLEKTERLKAERIITEQRIQSIKQKF